MSGLGCEYRRQHRFASCKTSETSITTYQHGDVTWPFKFFNRIVMSAEIAQFTAHPLDHNLSAVAAAQIAKNAELDVYLGGLLKWAYEEHDGRKFYFAQRTTEVHASLLKVISGDTLVTHADVIANRLLKKEKETHKEVAHLHGVQQGMLLQAVFSTGSTSGIIMAKVDFSEFLRRKNFRSDLGIDKRRRLLKFCVAEYSDKLEITDVHVGDTNATIAAYWWKDFLELTERRTDAANTEVAFAQIDAFLARSIKKDYPRDYPVLFNEMLRYFKRNRPFSLNGFLTDLFDHYTPQHENLDIVDLKRRANITLDKKKFDQSFTIVPSKIERRFKKTYSLTPQIDLTVSGELTDGQISALELDDGTKGVFVKSDKGFDQFPLFGPLQSQ